MPSHLFMKLFGNVSLFSHRLICSCITPKIGQLISNDGVFSAAHSFSNEFIEVKDWQHMDSQTSYELNWHPYVQPSVKNSSNIYNVNINFYYIRNKYITTFTSQHICSGLMTEVIALKYYVELKKIACSCHRLYQVSFRSPEKQRRNVV